jgi:riboflavin kinase/FMN adenylyltransferase
MKIVSWQDLISGRGAIQGRVSATIGAFDGIHIGHQKLMRAIAANSAEATPVVLTFRTNPGLLLRPDLPAGNILSPRQKNSKLAGLGVRVVILIDFSHEFSTLTGSKFVQQLRNCLDVKKIVVGYNFHFGRNRDTDASGLAHMLEGSGIEIEVIQPTLFGNEVVSSSRLRSAIRNGRFTQARSMLAADYTIDLLSVKGIERQGERVSVPRRSLSQLLPEEGHYPAFLLTDTGEIKVRVSVTSRALSWESDDRRTVNEIRFVEDD